MSVQLVWFKRDLRLFDHAALSAAAMRGPVLPLVIIEPGYWQQDDVSGRQWDFWRGCIDDLAQVIAATGGKLIIRVGEAIDVLADLRVELNSFTLFSHEETGAAWTFERDKAVARWCKANQVVWRESPQFGVVRGAKLNRDRWSQAWDRMMASPTQPIPAPLIWADARVDHLPTAQFLALPDDPLKAPQTPGRGAALSVLHSFLYERGEHYTRQMSSPVSAEEACSRLSPYLAYGCVSMREVAQAGWQRYRELPPAEKHWRQSIRSFIARLHWHCHFIQKLEAEPEAEWRPFARLYEGLRPLPGNAAYLAAWDTGKTGYPFVDAAMRYLNATGWINFRMRAMLMSFASYDLWLPWQVSGKLLARKFTDYEPGIHWPQCQMQAGETGINTIRIYSPVKQGYDQDADGSFVRRWVPELSKLPNAYLQEPWKMSTQERAFLCPDYPPPIVDHALAAKTAKDAIYAIRRKPEARAQAKAVVQKHGSRKRTAARRRRGETADQLVLKL